MNCTTTAPVWYGLLGLTHGGARIVTVLRDNTTPGWFDTLNVAPDDFYIVQGADEYQPVQLHERRDGAIGRLIRAHQIVILDNSAWMHMKQMRATAVD